MSAADLHIFYCGEAADQRLPEGVRALRSGKGSNCQFELGVGAFESVLGATFDSVLADFHIVAGYVVAADMAVSRGGLNNIDSSDHYRHFKLRIPVTDPGLWQSPPVRSQLQSAVRFLSGDSWTFEFMKASRPDHVTSQMHLSKGGPWGLPPRTEGGDVLMFSGGIDSLTGVVDLFTKGDAEPILVSHRIAVGPNSMQDELLRDAQALLPDFRPRHLKIGFDKIEPNGWMQEHSFRTRTLLYTALGAAAAHWSGRDRLLFFENGVVAMNLPISEQVVATMATRTAHPRALAALAGLISILLNRPFRIENPWLFKTRREVIEHLSAMGAASLLRKTVSCAHCGSFLTGPLNCGTCTQCIDRRIAVTAAGLSEYDPADSYREDFRIGGRQVPRSPRGSAIWQNRNTLAGFIRTAMRHSKYRGRADMLDDSAEVNRVITEAKSMMAGSTENVGDAIADLHRRHGLDVVRAAQIWRDDFGATEGMRPEAGSLLALLPHDAEMALTTAELPDTTSSPAPDRRFERREGVLHVAYPGDPSKELPGKAAGLAIIEYILAHPRTTPTPLDVLKAIGKAGENLPEPRSMGPATTRKSLQLAQKEIKRIQAEATHARLAGDDDKADRLEEQARLIQDQIDEDTRPGGGVRDASPDGERIRKKVHAAVQRALIDLDEAGMVHLSAHLKRSVKVSVQQARYTDGASGAWLTSWTS